jgi:hypothetical protein
VFPLRIALTHLADWEHERLVWLVCRRSLPNQDGGFQPSRIWFEVEGDEKLVSAVRSFII